MRLKSAPCFLLLVCFGASCGNNTGVGSPKLNNTNKNAPINYYRYAKSGDTIILKLVQIGESVTGTLVYKVPNKNTSKGTIHGSMTGDLLVVRYKPLVDSSDISEKVFKLTGKYFVEGTGETANENGMVKYKNIDRLKFIDSIRLDEIDCK